MKIRQRNTVNKSPCSEPINNRLYLPLLVVRRKKNKKNILTKLCTTVHNFTSQQCLDQGV